jgi:sugar O-acyltransferase (sialic acid O-acetyltransferase NeuD family)
MRVLVIGAGGHAKVVADILESYGIPVLGFLDDDSRLWGEKWHGLSVLGGIDLYAHYQPAGLVLGIGSNEVRQQIAQRLGADAHSLWRCAIHPRAVVAPSAALGQGVVIAAGAIINPDVVLADHIIVNTAASVDHDCVIESFVHIAPGAHLAGNVHVGEGTLIGIGASVIPGKKIGRWSCIAAGAVVTRDIPDSTIAKGIPARW